MRAGQNVRLVLRQPQRLGQRQRAVHLRQAGRLVKPLPVQLARKRLRLRLRAPVQPDQAGAERPAGGVHGHQGFSLRRQAQRGRAETRRGFQNGAEAPAAASR